VRGVCGQGFTFASEVGDATLIVWYTLFILIHPLPPHLWRPAALALS
jgi:hypothetical protein